MIAISGTSGLSRSGFTRNEQINLKMRLIVNAGDHTPYAISEQKLPFEFMFGWKTFVINEIFPGLYGRSGEN